MPHCQDGLPDGINVTAMNQRKRYDVLPLREILEMVTYYRKKIKSWCFAFLNRGRVSEMRKVLAVNFGFPDRELWRLSQGHEGVVFIHDGTVYKSFYEHLVNRHILDILGKMSTKCNLLLPIRISKTGNFDVIIHPYVKGEHGIPTVQEIMIFLAECKKHNILYWDFKKENFIITNGICKLVDYGISFEPYDDLVFKQSCMKAYIFAKYTQMKPWTYKYLCKQIDKGKYPKQLLGSCIQEMMMHENFIELLFNENKICKDV